MASLPFTFTRHNMLFLLICLGGIGLLVSISILPIMAENHQLSQRLPELEDKISSQRDLLTMLAAFDNKLAQLEKLDSLPAVANSSLPITELYKVISDITKIGDKLSLKENNITALMPKSAVNLKEISFSNSAKGKLSTLRSYIFSLLQITYIGKIKQLEIRTDNNELLVELIFTVRLS